MRLPEHSGNSFTKVRIPIATDQPKMVPGTMQQIHVALVSVSVLGDT